MKIEVRDAILAERVRQDIIWGGKSHDDTHSEFDWRMLIYNQIHDGNDFRNNMVKVATLAIAAIESYDRRHK